MSESKRKSSHHNSAKSNRSRHLRAIMAHTPEPHAVSRLLNKPLMRSLDQGVREEQHERDDEAIDRQRLHEGEREQQHAAQVIRNLRLAADAIDATARSDTPC